MKKQALPIIEQALSAADQIYQQACRTTTRTTALRSKLGTLEHIGLILEQEKTPAPAHS